MEPYLLETTFGTTLSQPQGLSLVGFLQRGVNISVTLTRRHRIAQYNHL
jgi:hypothetical protein